MWWNPRYIHFSSSQSRHSTGCAVMYRVNRTTERRHEVELADALEDSIVLRAVLNRPFQFRKAKIYAQLTQFGLESRKPVGLGAVDVGHRLRGTDHPGHCRR